MVYERLLFTKKKIKIANNLRLKDKEATQTSIQTHKHEDIFLYLYICLICNNLELWAALQNIHSNSQTSIYN